MADTPKGMAMSETASNLEMRLGQIAKYYARLFDRPMLLGATIEVLVDIWERRHTEPSRRAAADQMDATRYGRPWVCAECRSACVGSICVKCGKATERLVIELEYARIKDEQYARVVDRTALAMELEKLCKQSQGFPGSYLDGFVLMHKREILASLRNH